MITMEQVEVTNIDDYIRQEKALGKTEIHWTKDKADILRLFLQRNGFNGESYLGIKNYE